MQTISSLRFVMMLKMENCLAENSCTAFFSPFIDNIENVFALARLNIFPTIDVDRSWAQVKTIELLEEVF